MAAPNNLAWLRLRHPEAVAARLVLIGDRVGAAELLRLGVVGEVLDDGAVLARCRERAVDLASLPAAGVAAMKSSMRAAWLGTSPEAWFAAFAAPVPAPFGGHAAVRT
jgi:enoyl-CoA hydratase/carnithine racemase